MQAMDLSNRLREERARLRISQVDAANRMSIPAVTYRTYETGRSAPSMNVYPKLRDAGFDADYVLTGRRVSQMIDEQVDWALIIEISQVILEWSARRTRALSPEEQASYLRLAYGWAEQKGAASIKEILQQMLKAA